MLIVVVLQFPETFLLKYHFAIISTIDWSMSFYCTDDRKSQRYVQWDTNSQYIQACNQSSTKVHVIHIKKILTNTNIPYIKQYTIQSRILIDISSILNCKKIQSLYIDSLHWSPSNERLLIIAFTNDDTTTNNLQKNCIPLLLQIQFFSNTLRAVFIGYIQGPFGDMNKRPNTIIQAQFYPVAFKKGEILGILWSSGIMHFLPLYHTSISKQI